LNILCSILFSIYDASVSNYEAVTVSGRKYHSAPCKRGIPKSVTLNCNDHLITFKVRSAKSFSNLRQNLSAKPSITAELYGRTDQTNLHSINDFYSFSVTDTTQKQLVGVKLSSGELISRGIDNSKSHLSAKHPNVALAISNNTSLIKYRLDFYAKSVNIPFYFSVVDCTQGISVKFETQQPAPQNSNVSNALLEEKEQSAFTNPLALSDDISDLPSLQLDESIEFVTQHSNDEDFFSLDINSGSDFLLCSATEEAEESCDLFAADSFVFDYNGLDVDLIL
jgi:hypothetical protein